MIHINERDFRGIDLNLLITFLVLMRERSVSRAAQKMFVGQPAMSAALTRMRQMFGDELFIRSAGGMIPTTRACELAAALAPALHGLGLSIQSSDFDPATSHRTFAIGMPDWVEMWLFPELLARVQASAPNVRIAVRSSDRVRATRMLESDEMHLGVTVIGEPASWQRSHALVSMNYACVYHPERIPVAAAALRLSHYLKYPHLFISYQGDFEGQVDARLAEKGKKRSVVYSTPHFANLPVLLGSVAAFATVPEFLAAAWAPRFGLRFAPVPVPLPDFVLSLTWHAKHESDGALRWLRQLIADTVALGTGRSGLGPLRKRGRHR